MYFGGFPMPPGWDWDMTDKEKEEYRRKKREKKKKKWYYNLF